MAYFREEEEIPSNCEHCGCIVGVQFEDARTRYDRETPSFWDRIQADDGGLTPVPDPNPPIALCRVCAKEHHDFWDAQWADYYTGQL